MDRFRQTVQDYNYSAEFQAIPIMGFRFIVLPYTPTYPHRDKVIAISAPPPPPYYVVGADNGSE